MLQMIDKYTEGHRMFNSGDTVVAGISGGADSMALLDVLHRLAPSRGFRLIAFHMNHNLRGEESDGDEAMVRMFCGQRGICLTVVSEDVTSYAKANHIGIEEAGRNLRRLHLKNAAERNTPGKVALAHHRDDQAETILHNMMRGTSLKGLGGMHPVNGNICRPFLEVSKDAIIRYCEDNGIPFRFDSSNKDNSFSRNRIRNILIPLMEREFNPQLKSRLSGMASLMREEESYLDGLASGLLDTASVDRADDTWILDTGRLLAEDRVVCARAMRLAIEGLTGSLRDISKVHVDTAVGMLAKETGKQVHLPGGIVIERVYDRLEMRLAHDSESAKGFPEQDLFIRDADSGIYEERQISLDGSTTLTYRIFDAEQLKEIPKNKYTKWFDYDRIVGNLTVRARRDGDFLRINPSMDKKKVKDIFIDEKVPRQSRDLVPIIADDEEVLWIVGYRMSDKYKITGTTARVLEVVVSKEEHRVGKS